MSRIHLLVPLLLATTVVLADDVPETERVTAVSDEQTQTEEGATNDATSDDVPETEGVAGASEEQTRTKDGAKLVSGMSVLGNREAPKSLVIVPWKSSEIGDSLGIAPMLDDSRQPVDREVFMRALSYYEIQHAGRGVTADVEDSAGPK
jgi:hypothetical protein